MPTQGTGNELATLERLRTDEAALDSALDDARRDAEKCVAAARARAARERADSSSRLHDELAARAAGLERERAAIAAAAREEAAHRIAQIDREAQRRFAAAVALLVAAVEGDSP